MDSVISSQAQMAFSEGCAFHEGAIRCATSKDEEGQRNLSSAVIVCAAFAAELYMKAIAMRRTGELVEGHNLQWLHDHALDDRERALIAHHSEALGRDASLLELDIKSFARSFTEFRYAFEQSFLGLSVSALYSFTRAAYLAAREIGSDWSVSESEHERLIANITLEEVIYVYARSPIEAAVRAGLLKPEPDITKSEDSKLRLTAPKLILDSQPAAINVKVRRDANPKDGGSDQPLE